MKEEREGRSERGWERETLKIDLRTIRPVLVSLNTGFLTVDITLLQSSRTSDSSAMDSFSDSESDFLVLARLVYPEESNARKEVATVIYSLACLSVFFLYPGVAILYQDHGGSLHDYHGGSVSGDPKQVWTQRNGSYDYQHRSAFR
jgi:hypothetical protein